MLALFKSIFIHNMKRIEEFFYSEFGKNFEGCKLEEMIEARFKGESDSWVGHRRNQLSHARRSSTDQLRCWKTFFPLTCSRLIYDFDHVALSLYRINYFERVMTTNIFWKLQIDSIWHFSTILIETFKIEKPPFPISASSLRKREEKRKWKIVKGFERRLRRPFDINFVDLNWPGCAPARVIGRIRRWSRYTGHRHRSSVAVTYVSCSFPPWIDVIANDFRIIDTRCLNTFILHEPRSSITRDLTKRFSSYILLFRYEESWRIFQILSNNQQLKIVSKGGGWIEKRRIFSRSVNRVLSIRNTMNGSFDFHPRYAANIEANI